MRRIALGLLVLTLAGCGGGSKHEATTSAHTGLQLAAIRLAAGTAAQYQLIELDPHGGQFRVLLSAPHNGDPPVGRLADPAWTPDGTALYVIGTTAELSGSDFTYPVSDVYRVHDDGMTETVTEAGDVLAAVPSPDGKSLVLERMDHPGTQPFTTSLWRADVDGSNLHRLFDEVDGSTDTLGGWSPDGSKITFARCPTPTVPKGGRVPNTCAVYVASPDGGQARKLAARALDPTFSPDGRRIAFVSDRDENGVVRVGSDEHAFANELYVMAADGGHQTRLTTTKGSEARPSWSQAGDRIAYQRQGEGFRKELWQTDPKGTCAVRIASDPADWYQEPAWRPGRVNAGAVPLCG